MKKKFCTWLGLVCFSLVCKVSPLMLKEMYHPLTGDASALPLLKLFITSKHFCTVTLDRLMCCHGLLWAQWRKTKPFPSSLKTSAKSLAWIQLGCSEWQTVQPCTHACSHVNSWSLSKASRQNTTRGKRKCRNSIKWMDKDYSLDHILRNPMPASQIREAIWHSVSSSKTYLVSQPWRHTLCCSPVLIFGSALCLLEAALHFSQNGRQVLLWYHLTGAAES